VSEIDLMFGAIGAYLAISSLVRLMKAEEVEVLMEVQAELERLQRDGGIGRAA